VGLEISEKVRVCIFKAIFNAMFSQYIVAHLGSLILHDNELTGELPANVGDLPSIHTLSLYLNQFSGPLPSSIGHATNLSKYYSWEDSVDTS
jgi:hypothetical protein